MLPGGVYVSKTINVLYLKDSSNPHILSIRLMIFKFDMMLQELFICVYANSL